MPGGPRGLQNRRRHASVEVGSIPILSAEFSLVILSSKAAGLKDPVAISTVDSLGFLDFARNDETNRREVNHMSREQIRKLTSLSSCAG